MFRRSVVRVQNVPSYLTKLIRPYTCKCDMISVWTLSCVCSNASMRLPSSPTSANTCANI